MPDYIRLKHQGGTYFFTVNLLQRKDNDLLLKNIHLLREAVRTVRAKYPFHIYAWVVLPDHMHCIWQLPPDDDNFSVRWRLIKSYFSRGIENGEIFLYQGRNGRKEAFGSVGFGSMPLEMTMILPGIWITFIIIR